MAQRLGILVDHAILVCIEISEFTVKSLALFFVSVVKVGAYVPERVDHIQCTVFAPFQPMQERLNPLACFRRSLPIAALS